MDRLIWISWRAFWVGLGASLVLIVQSLGSTPDESPKPVEPAVVVPAPAPPPAAAVKVKSVESADPIYSRNPVDSKRGPLSCPSAWERELEGEALDAISPVEGDRAERRAPKARAGAISETGSSRGRSPLERERE